MTSRRGQESIASAASTNGVCPTRVGPWELVRLVGEGEWARVFQARPTKADPEQPADYALKILKSPFEAQPAYVALFQREEYVGRRVSDRHLAPVLASSLTRSPYWLALPFLEGISLETRLLAGPPLRPASALWVVRQVAEALDALHRAGWLHGDVKPHNVVVSPNGHATLVDLGFTRALDPALAAAMPTADIEMIAATPAYAAPETFDEPARFSAASDIYSLGVTLFECLTGRRPFPSAQLAVLSDAHRRQPPPDVRQFAPHTPSRVADLVWQMLAKNPASRPVGQRLLDVLVTLEIETFDDRGTPPAPAFDRKSA